MINPSEFYPKSTEKQNPLLSLANLKKQVNLLPPSVLWETDCVKGPNSTHLPGSNPLCHVTCSFHKEVISNRWSWILRLALWLALDKECWGDLPGEATPCWDFGTPYFGLGVLVKLSMRDHTVMCYCLCTYTLLWEGVQGSLCKRMVKRSHRSVGAGCLFISGSSDQNKYTKTI